MNDVASVSLEKDGNSHGCNEDTLWNASKRIHRLTECNAVRVVRLITQTIIEGLTPIAVKGDEVPDAAAHLCSEYYAKQDVEGFDHSILL